MFKPTNRQLVIAALWLVFIVLFWFLGPAEKMGKATAFFGLAGLTAVYGALAWGACRILDGFKPKA